MTLFYLIRDGKVINFFEGKQSIFSSHSTTAFKDLYMTNKKSDAIYFPNLKFKIVVSENKMKFYMKKTFDPKKIQYVFDDSNVCLVDIEFIENFMSMFSYFIKLSKKYKFISEIYFEIFKNIKKGYAICKKDDVILIAKRKTPGYVVDEAIADKAQILHVDDKKTFVFETPKNIVYYFWNDKDNKNLPDPIKIDVLRYILGCKLSLGLKSRIFYAYHKKGISFYDRH